MTARTKRPRRGRAGWLEAAKSALIEHGIERVKVEPLAATLGLTTGSFYHHFKHHQDLLDELLKHWEAGNSEPLFAAVREAGSDPDDQFDGIFETWISEKDYDPAYDRAVRAWAHCSEAAAAAVKRVDDRRIALLTRIFLDYGYDPDRAYVRARVTYFTQVGYQAMEIAESREERERWLALYREVLVGMPSKRHA